MGTSYCYYKGAFYMLGVHAAGVTFEGRQENLTFVQKVLQKMKYDANRVRYNVQIDFVRDYDNKYDSNAVKIIARCWDWDNPCLDRLRWGESHHVLDCGYLPWYIAKVIAPKMDLGQRFIFHDVRIVEGGKDGMLKGLVFDFFWDASERERAYFEKQAQAVG